MNKYNVPALEKTITILELISDSKERFTVTELCTNLDMPKATVFTIMSTLEYYKMVVKDSAGKFNIGPKLFQLGMTYASDYNVVELAKPHMQKLMESTGLTVHLGVLHENQIMYVAKEEPNNFIKFSTYPGLKTQIHLSGLGKAIAAYLNEDEINQIVKDIGFPKATPNTITSMSKFKESLQEVRENGFSIEDEEGEIGVRCIAAPILNGRHETTTAISVASHISQLKPEQFKELGELVKTTAQDISKVI